MAMLCSSAFICGIAFGAVLKPQNSSQAPSPQTAQLLASYEGQNVASIQLAGQPGLDTKTLTLLFAQHAGEPFSKTKLDRTIAAIERTGHVQTIELQVEPEANGVRVLLVLQPAYSFGIYEFPGADRFSYSRLLQVTNYPPETAYNTGDIQEATGNLVRFFQQQGYFQAQVSPKTTVDAGHKLVNVLFRVTLGKRSKFGHVEITGTPPTEAARLTKDLQGVRARLRGAAIRLGKNFRHKTLTNATQYLQGKLAKQGYLDAKVQLVGAEYSRTTNRADIRFQVHTGPVIHVKIEGAHLWTWTKKSLLPVYQGAGVDHELVQEGNTYLSSYFQGKGYFDVKVFSHFEKGTSVDTILYRIDKGKKHRVESVRLSGNKHIPSDQLMPYLTVQKKRMLSRGKYSEKLLRTSVEHLTNIYSSEGFSAVQVTPDVSRRNSNIDITFHVDEGPRNVVASLRIEGAETFPKSRFAPNGLKISVGRPYSRKFVNSDRKTVLAHYLEAGYLTATFRETATAVSKRDPHRINVVYHIYEGPRVLTLDVITLGRGHTNQRLIDQDVSSIKAGEPLSETKLLHSESKLYSNTGVFDWAEIAPRRPITTQTGEDVLVKVHEAKRNQITYGFGFEMINRGGNIPSGTVAIPGIPPIGLPSNFTTSQKTYYGPRGTFQYTRNNMRGKGEILSLTAFAGRLDQSGGAYYIDPNLHWSNWSSTLALTVEHNGENPIFSSQQELASLQFQRSLDLAKTRIFFLRYSFSQTDLTQITIPDLVLPEDQHVRLSTVSSSFTRDARDNPLDARKGILESAELDFNSTKLGSSVDFAKLTGQVAYYKRIPDNIIWANSIRIGLAQPFAGSRVPVSEEFFTGGGSTLRGFPLDGAGPQRQVKVCPVGSTTNCSYIQVAAGGHELLILNSEFRIPLPIMKNLGVALFYDGGNVFPNVGFHDFTSLYSNNVGAGLRYATPVGPIRIDFGRNLNPVPGVKATQYFISIGQAF